MTNIPEDYKHFDDLYEVYLKKYPEKSLDGIEARTQILMNVAEELREAKRYKESIRLYLDAIKEGKQGWELGVTNTEWQKKVTSMACTGMGISYSKLGISFDAVQNFIDAVNYAPDQKSKKIAEANLDKCLEQLKIKEGK